MRVILDTFFTLCYFTAIFIQLIIFVRNAVKSVYSTRAQRIFQLFFLFALVFLTFNQMKLLKTIYKQRIFDFENNPLGSRLKSLQYMSESTLHSVLIYSFAVMFNYFCDFKLRSITDQKMYSVSLVAYGFLRSIPIIVIMSQIYSNTPFSSFMFETFIVSENVVKILILISIIKAISKITVEIDACLMDDKTMLQHFLSMMDLICKKLVIALFFECFYRLLYLVVIMNHKSSVLSFLKDASNLAKVFSIYLMLDALSEVSFVDCKDIKASCNENDNDKFFSLEETNKL